MRCTFSFVLCWPSSRSITVSRVRCTSSCCLYSAVLAKKKRLLVCYTASSRTCQDLRASILAAPGAQENCSAGASSLSRSHIADPSRCREPAVHVWPRQQHQRPRHEGERQQRPRRRDGERLHQRPRHHQHDDALQRQRPRRQRDAERRRRLPRPLRRRGGERLHPHRPQRRRCH